MSTSRDDFGIAIRSALLQRGARQKFSLFFLLCLSLIIFFLDIYPNKIEHYRVELTYAKMDMLIGETIKRDVVKSILKDLEIEVLKETSEGLDLLVPPFKVDVQREVDVIEEILRIYGYNTVTIPSMFNTSIISSDTVNAENTCDKVADLLSNTGFNETINNSLTKAENTVLISELDASQNIQILNPLSKELNVMRQSLLFSGLENIAYNHNRKSMDIKIYEFGKTYRKKGQKYSESQHLQVLVSGRLHPENWNANSDKADFFFIKEKVEHILNRLGIKDVQSEQVNTYGFEEALMYKCKNKRLVCFGKLDNKICKAFDVKSEVYAADFDWDTVLDLVGHTKTGFQEISKFPVVRRDLSLLVDKSVSFDKLRMIAIKVDNKILKSVSLFDVYEGSKLPDGKKSYALAFTMGDATRTLTDMHVDKVMKKLMNSFRQQVGAEIR